MGLSALKPYHYQDEPAGGGKPCCGVNGAWGQLGGVPDRGYEGGRRREIDGMRWEIYEANPAYYTKTHHLREKRNG